IDLIISKELCVDDFNVNQLTYDSKNKFVSYGQNSVDQLLQFISQKKMIMLQKYIFNQKTDQQKTLTKNRINKFISKGWNILNYKENPSNITPSSEPDKRYPVFVSSDSKYRFDRMDVLIDNKSLLDGRMRTTNT